MAAPGEPAGRLKKLDLEDEEAESFGAGRIEDFTQKQMLDFYACVECGRCTNACPASNTGKPLSPMHLITKLRDHLQEKGTVITGKSPKCQLSPIPCTALMPLSLRPQLNPFSPFGATRPV